MKRKSLSVLSAILCVATGLALWSLGGCGQRIPAVAPNKTIGTVDGKPLSQGWFIDRFFEFSNKEAFYQYAGNETAWMSKEALHFLAEDKLAELARRLKLDEKAGFKAVLEEKVNQLLVRDYRSVRLYGGIQVSKREMQRFYQDNQDDFTRREKYEFYYIAISKKKRPPLEAKRMAEEAYAKLAKGEDFLAVAHDYSDVNPFTKLKMFTLTAGQRRAAPVLLDTLAGLAPTEVSRVVESDDYYFIVNLQQVQPAVVAPFSQVEPLVRSEIFRREAERVRAAFRAKMEKSESLKIELNDSLLRKRDASGYDIVLAIRDKDGKEILVLTLNDFYRLATGYPDVRDQIEFLHQLAEDEMVKRAADRENFREDPVVKYDVGLWTTHFLAEAYLEQRIEDDGLKFSDQEVDKYLDENAGLRQTLKQVRAHVITKRADVSAEMERPEKKAAMMLAENETWDVLSKIVRGLDFRVAAKLYSDDPSARVGGDIGVVYSGPMGRRFDEVAFRMQEGEISEPVELQEGYMLIWVDRVFPPEKLSDEEARRRARERMASLARDEIRLEEFNKMTDPMSATWDHPALLDAANRIKDMDSDRALILYRQRYGM